ncbi:MAG: type I-E CRISPR-associated protein Cas5/CasD [Cellvibrionaceae bacterium]|nr:type I-E CRISPR-associated protein Cas5/CasD [Cellvibrionaceae bacterium]
MSNPYLLLWLEAPLQSWGHDSKFGRRDSLDFPTKSGVLGLLCCALGAGASKRNGWRAGPIVI